MRLNISFLRKTLAYVLTLAVTVTSAGFGGAALPWNTHEVSAKEKPGYHLESSEQDYTYTIIRNEDKSEYKAYLRAEVSLCSEGCLGTALMTCCAVQRLSCWC